MLKAVHKYWHSALHTERSNLDRQSVQILRNYCLQIDIDKDKITTIQQATIAPLIERYKPQIRL